MRAVTKPVPPRTLTRAIHVSLAYRLWDERWSSEENRRRYGKSASPEGLGGNWRVEIHRKSDPENDHLAMAALDAQAARIKALIDHRALFRDIPAFAKTPSTLENVCAFLSRDFFLQEPEGTEIVVFESDKAWCGQCRDEAEQTLTLRVLNLDLSFRGPRDEAGLMTSRELVTQEVMNLFKGDLPTDQESWGETLLSVLQQSLPQLAALRVDLGSGRYIVVGA